MSLVLGISFLFEVYFPSGIEEISHAIPLTPGGQKLQTPDLILVGFVTSVFGLLSAVAHVTEGERGQKIENVHCIINIPF